MDNKTRTAPVGLYASIIGIAVVIAIVVGVSLGHGKGDRNPAAATSALPVASHSP